MFNLFHTFCPTNYNLQVLDVWELIEPLIPLLTSECKSEEFLKKDSSSQLSKLRTFLERLLRHAPSLPDTVLQGAGGKAWRACCLASCCLLHCLQQCMICGVSCNPVGQVLDDEFELSI